MKKVHSSLERIAEQNPSKVAIITKNGHFSYKFINDMAGALAEKLVREYNIWPGDRITLMISDKNFFLIAYYAILKAQAIVVPVDHLLTNNEIKYILNHSKARFLLTDQTITLENLLEELPLNGRKKIKMSTHEQDQIYSYYSLCCVRGNEKPTQIDKNRINENIAVITYTSGTTGVPKGVVITHESIFRKMESFTERLKISDQDKILSELSIVYIYGQIMVMNLSIWNGATAVLLDGRNPKDIIHYLENEKITVMLSIPITYTSMNDYIKSKDLKVRHHLRYAITGGNLITNRYKRDTEESLGVKLFESYGLTETTAAVIMENPMERRKFGSLGKALPGCSVQIWDEDGMDLAPGQIGEIVVKTTSMMNGYFRDNYTQSASFTDGWFHTGDLGYQDIDGYYFIVDRRKDIIKTLGFVISSSEVEEVLLSHPYIKEAAVVGIDDKECDEEIKAYLVTNAHAKIDAKELQEYLSYHLASFKIPTIFEFVEILPRNNSGKLLKGLLK